jgi:hypothetical protein
VDFEVGGTAYRHASVGGADSWQAWKLEWHER